LNKRREANKDEQKLVGSTQQTINSSLYIITHSIEIV